MNTVKEFPATRIILCARANDVYLEPFSIKSQRFLPNPPVEWDRKILDKDENTAAIADAALSAHLENPRLSTASWTLWYRTKDMPLS
jgi:hypothetical protein